jgi:26S proteasome regulatory subunit N9
MVQENEPTGFYKVSRQSCRIIRYSLFVSLLFNCFVGNKDESIALLEGLADRIKKENLTDILPVSYILARIEASQYYLISSVPENVNRARDYIDECIELVETMPVSPPLAVQASVYRISALFDKFSLNYSAFYRHSLLHLACLSQESLESTVEAEKRVEAAHDLCIAALLADDIFNFGELLENSILNSLKGTQFEFLLKLVSSFNSGDLSILAPSSNNSALNNHPALLAHVPFLQEKLCLMSLAQLLFTQLKTDRRVPFSTISHATKVPLDQVEFLLIRAISCKIIRGIIDQVDSSINVSWIQPRLLDQNQVGDLFSAINSWNKKVVHTLEIVQEMREKGAFSESTTTII